METRNEPHTSVKDTRSERELGESVFETPLNRAHEGAVQEFQAKTECTYIGSVEFHQLENNDRDICHMETGAYSAASAGGQILSDESEDNGDNKVDDCNEKLDWRKQLDCMLEELSAQNKELENTSKIVRSCMAKIQSCTEVKGKVLTPEGDKRVGMGEKEEESTPPWATPTCRAETEILVIQPKTEPIRGKKRKGRHKKQQKDDCKAS